MRRLLPVLLLLSSLGAALAVPGRPARAVLDQAHILSASEEARLDEIANRLWAEKKLAFVALTVTTLEDESAEAFATRVYQTWGVGEKGKDRGILLLVAMKEKRWKFESGYGAEGDFPDAILSRVGFEELVPRFKRGEYGEGMIASALRIGRIGGADLSNLSAAATVAAPRAERPPPRVSAPFQWKWYHVLILVVLAGFLLGTRTGRHILFGILLGLLSGGSRRGGGFGGGFGGGGFGGFGGGRSGGGGAGGSW